MSVAPITPPVVAPIDTSTSTTKTNGASGPGFGEALADARELETKAATQADQFAKGDTSVGIHEVMIASEKANIALRFATTLKNKAVEAYRELMNTQV